ncbi:MAG TPA: TonB family protein [Burkholderiales bacterium]|nr:TonB family protein [Burkholderiales bacterium]
MALAAAFSSVSATALPADQTARVLAGLDTVQGVALHARTISASWNDYERRIGRPMREWAHAELASAPGATVFYPFSGPDFPTVAQLYPDATRFVLVAAQRAAPPPTLEGGAPETLAALWLGLQKFTRSGFFNTKDLDAAGPRLGATAFLMAFAVRLGYEVVAVDPMRLNGAGDLELHPDDRKRRDTWDSVRLSLARNGRAVQLDYVRMDLADANLAADRAARAWVERMAANPVVIKAASHLPQRPHFSILREAILAHAPGIWQDETGIDYSRLAETFDVRLYGSFAGPNRIFSSGSQKSLAGAYRRTGAEPLPFRVGYEKRAGSSVQVAVRDARSLEAKVADRIARYESRPRKLFMSGRDGVEYVTALKSRVAGVAAPLAVRHDPGRAVLLTLTLAADGTLKALDLDRSSGNAAFDRGLRESVRRATFPPLPEAIRREADLLVVTLQLPER